MSRADLKNILIARINQIDDDAFLEALKVLTDLRLESRAYHLSDFEKSKVEEGRKQNKTIDHETAMKEINQWLKK